MMKIWSSLRKKDSLPSESLPLPAGNYEVFLSFRGPDLRLTFADGIYSFLLNNGIRTFFDNEELRKGKETASNLIKAIEESKIYIPIFSSNYASSKWCLMELACMVKCYEQGKGHLILPIFHSVEPRDVRHQKGYFGEAFRRLDDRYDAETTKEWKEALRKVGKLTGWHVTASDRQGAVIAEVFSAVRSHLMESYKLVTGELVGIDPHVEQVKGLLNKGVQIVGIQGMSGIGKTDIAKAVYDSVCAQFNRCCFVGDVREILSKNDGIVSLQNKILSSILRHDTKVNDASEGIRIIQGTVGCSRSLIVLDDVGAGFDFKQTLGKLNKFSLESRFIITTVDERVMEFFHQYELYQPGEMSYDNGLQLFSRHAFGMDYPPQDYMALSKDFVETAAGLPLALKAIGSLLFRKDKGFWGEKLIQFRDIPPVKVQERLEIIYMELTDEEKHIFLDIACFFTGEHVDRPYYMWKECGLYPEIMIEALRLKSLIKINERNKFWMHDHYKNLGRAIVRKEDFRSPWKRSRIWSNKNVLDMLRDNEGTDGLEILKVDLKGEDFELTDKKFKKLSGIKYLEVSNGRLTGDFKDILQHVLWLRLDSCSSIPIDINVNNLVILEVWRCSITDDWRGWNKIKVARKLKVVHLWSCKNLRTAPDLSQCGTLECLNLQNCQKMRGDLQIANCENLKVLKLGFTKITKLTGDIGILKNLQEIDAGGSNLIEVPAGIGKLSSLKSLDLRSNKLQSKELAILPVGLKRLYLSSPQVPNLLELKDLEELWFSNCDAPEIPGDVWKLSKLKTLILSDCPCDSLLGRTGMSSSLPALPSSLNRLKIDGCAPLKRLPNLVNLNNLIELFLTQVGVREIVGLGGVKRLESLTISDAPNLINLSGLEHLVLLQKLHLRSCDVLGRLPNISNLTQLQILEIVSCDFITSVSGLENLGDSLSCLKISGPSSASTLPSLPKLAKLTKLSLNFCGTDRNPQLLSRELILNFSRLQSVEELSIIGCEQLIKVNGIERLESLQSLCLPGCNSIRKLPDLSGIKNLRCLEIQRCTQLTEVKGLEKLESFGGLNMSGCTSMKELPSLGKNLINLNVSGCKQLTELLGLEKLESLQILNMSKCTSVRKLPDLSSFKDLSALHIRGCIQLTDLTGIDRLKSLISVTMDARLEDQYLDLLRVIKNRGRIH